MSLCTPAFVYAVLSSIGIIMIAYQNYGNSNLYCVGNVTCPVQSTTPIFIAKILYVIFWTFIFNTLCSYGYYKLSWFIILLPFILFFIIVSILGNFINNHTTNVSGSGNNVGREQPFNTYQQQAQQQHQQQQQQKPQQPQQPQWTQQMGQADGGYYSSYGDYDRALDNRTQQVFNESHEKGQTHYEYK